jgi:hypothetical chaperone protein
VVHSLLYEGQAYDFYRAIEATKIKLSRDESAEVGFEPLGLRVVVKRAAFESMIRPELDLVSATIERALQEAGIAAAVVDRVLVTGGSGYIPAFRADLAAIFGDERLEQRDAFTAVVHGLGVRAQQLWGPVSIPLM